MSDDVRFIYFVVQGSQFDVSVAAPDDKNLNVEQVKLQAEMAARGWNRRRAARLCPEHDWRGFDEEPVDPTESVALCVLCGITHSEWQQQKIEEALTPGGAR